MYEDEDHSQLGLLRTASAFLTKKIESKTFLFSQLNPFFSTSFFLSFCSTFFTDGASSVNGGSKLVFGDEETEKTNKNDRTTLSK